MYCILKGHEVERHLHMQQSRNADEPAVPQKSTHKSNKCNQPPFFSKSRLHTLCGCPIGLARTSPHPPIVVVFWHPPQSYSERITAQHVRSSFVVHPGNLRDKSTAASQPRDMHKPTTYSKLLLILHHARCSLAFFEFLRRLL